MMARIYYHRAKFGGNRTTHLGVTPTRQSVMFFTLFLFPFFLFVCHAFGNVVGLVQQQIASVFVGRRGLQCFKGKKPCFQRVKLVVPNSVISVAISD